MATRRPILTPKARDEALHALQQHYAENHLELNDLETRIEQVERAISVAEVNDALSGLPPLPFRGEVVGLVKLPDAQVSSPAHIESLVAVLGATTRHGAWTPPPLTRIITVLGSALVDLTEARLEGVTEIRVRSVLGSVKILVPQGVRVECRGLAVAGAFPVFDQASEPVSAQRGVVVRISGWTLLGSVEVEVREKRGLLENLKGLLRR